MNTCTDTVGTCPHGQENCPVLIEIVKLRNECKRLKELSRIDPLTGFFNFRYLIEALSGEMERTRRTGLPTSFIMIDLDLFKRINDRYGHENGNKALKWAGSIFSDNIRKLDIPCRYGGEEFGIILPGTPLKGAVYVAERLRRELAARPVPFDDKDPSGYNLTASFGVDVYNGRMEISANGFIKKADHFLLKAKEGGRNRTCYDVDKTITKPSEVSLDERKALGVIKRSKFNP